MLPSPAASDGSQGQTAAQEQITFRFCRDCSNMLYPRENMANDKLMFACRTCEFTEEATGSCIYRNHLYNTAGETAGVTQDVGSDPTVGISDFHFCTFCGEPLKCCMCDEICEGHIGGYPLNHVWAADTDEEDDYDDYEEEVDDDDDNDIDEDVGASDEDTDRNEAADETSKNTNGEVDKEAAVPSQPL